MAGKHSRIIGTTNYAISEAERELGFSFPPSYRKWLIANNGLFGVGDVNIFSVLDERDARKTFDSIVRNYKVNWLTWLENFEADQTSFEHLLPFADFGTGDYYCFDYSEAGSNGEVSVVHWSHETGEIEHRGENFEDFLKNLIRGDFEFD